METLKLTSTFSYMATTANSFSSSGSAITGKDLTKSIYPKLEKMDLMIKAAELASQIYTIA